MLTIGELDRRIEIQTVEGIANTYGEIEFTYELLQAVWSKVYHKSGKATEESDEMINVNTTIFYIRNIGINIQNMTEQYRIYYNKNYYYIETINEIDGRERFLEIITTEKNNLR